MPQKTKKEKIIAEQRRRNEILHSPGNLKYSFNMDSPSQKNSEKKPDYGLQMEIGHIKKDLIKISIFTLLAIGFQFTLHFFVIK